MFGLSTDALLLFGLGLLPAVSLALSAIWTLLGPLRLRSRAEGTVVGLDAAFLGNPIVEFAARATGTTVRYVQHQDPLLVRKRAHTAALQPARTPSGPRRDTRGHLPHPAVAAHARPRPRVAGVDDGQARPRWRLRIASQRTFR